MMLSDKDEIKVGMNPSAEWEDIKGKDKDALLDVAVLLVFFTRPDTFRRVFERVRQARPSELFLYQDGPRPDRPDDRENIRKCRRIAENIDWNCRVHRLYQAENKGVDPSGYLADSWAFSIADKCIVLEDDVLPSKSFFAFCKEMLDRYERDPGVMLISGINNEEVTADIKEDYFFSSTTFTWGWASWSRVVRQWDPEYRFLKDPVKRKAVEDYIRKKKLVRNMVHIFENHRDSGIEHFETILISNQYLHKGLTIVPKRNMIRNIGASEGASHFANHVALIPKGIRRIFKMKSYEVDVKKLCHPTQVRDFEPYRKRSYRIMAWGHPLVKVYRLVESFCYKLHAGQGKSALEELRHKFHNLFNRISA